MVEKPPLAPPIAPAGRRWQQCARSEAFDGKREQ
jgi:hypothetical protein